MSKVQPPESANPPVVFRLGRQNHPLLVEQARELGVKPNKLARALVLKGLREQEVQASWHDLLALLRLEIRELRRDISVSAEALLTSAGEVEEKEAKAWVSKNLSPADG